MKFTQPSIPYRFGFEHWQQYSLGLSTDFGDEVLTPNGYLLFRHFLCIITHTNNREISIEKMQLAMFASIWGLAQTEPVF